MNDQIAESPAPSPRSAIVTVAIGPATEKLDYTFTSFARHNPGVSLHAFILGSRLPERRSPEVNYHLVPSVPDFSHPLREVYFRRHELIDQLEMDHVLIVDCYDVLCLQPLPPFAAILGDSAVAACVEHMGARFLDGPGYTANFLNGGVFFWNVAKSRQMRKEIVERGRHHFRTVADDQHCLNEVIQTRYYEHLRILPCQYNFRAYLRYKQRGWPSVDHLDGVLIYHNATCMETARKLSGVKPHATLPELPADAGPLSERQQFWRRLRQRLKPWVIR